MQASSDPQGGATWLVDGFSIAARLKEEHPNSFAFFAKQPLPFRCIQPGTFVEAIATPFVVDEYLADNISADHDDDNTKKVVRHRMHQFRYNNDDRAPLKIRPSTGGGEEGFNHKSYYRRDGSLSVEDVEAFYREHLPNLLKCSQDPSMALEIRLEPGNESDAERVRREREE